MLNVLWSRSDETVVVETLAATDLDAADVVDSGDCREESKDSDAIGAVDTDPACTPDPLVPATLTSAASEDLALPFTSPPPGMSASELELVPAASEPCPAASPDTPPVADDSC